MAALTLTDNQWKSLVNYNRGAPAGGSVTIDVVAGDLVVTWYPLPSAAGTAQGSRKSGAAGQQK
jgi:hypothetical protein